MDELLHAAVCNIALQGVDSFPHRVSPCPGSMLRDEVVTRMTHFGI